ncbi:MAG: type II toxin-antitoxin system ParD family antitoxin [Tepidisphaeraceae bacterium]|jgi:antitoxin ParD1/3/4
MAHESNSVTMNLSLPKPLKQYVDGKVSSGIYGSSSEFVREAIREKLEREQSRASLTAKLVEGLNSGKPIPFTDEYFKRKKNALAERVGRKNKMS